MKIETFDDKYKEEGGFEKLSRMRAILSPQHLIATHFGVSRECVKIWMKNFFGEKYDPREERRRVKEVLNNINK